MSMNIRTVEHDIVGGPSETAIFGASLLGLDKANEVASVVEFKVGDGRNVLVHPFDIQRVSDELRRVDEKLTGFTLMILGSIREPNPNTGRLRTVTACSIFYNDQTATGRIIESAG